MHFTASVPAPDIRLVGGSGPHEGRVEIQYNGEWGTLSSSASRWRFSNTAYHESQDHPTAVICRQLGFNDGESYETPSEIFGPGTGMQWNRVEFCYGFHDFPCVYNVLGEVTADHSLDVGIICNGE